MIRAIAVALSLAAGVAQSAPIEASQRPISRPAIDLETDRPVKRVAPVRPLPRPASPQEVAMAGAASDMPLRRLEGAARPILRPALVPQLAMAKRQQKRKGAVCDDLEIQGEEAGNIPGRLAICGIYQAVRVTSVAGVKLSTPSLMNCETAQALRIWTEESVIPTFRKRGPVVEMNVAAHYACRTRNNQPGARISEHGKGRAIDISGFVMKDGEVITLRQGWQKKDTRAMLERVHKGACGPFGTVLGPRADRYHQDHFHFDTARYRSGPYCR